MFADETSAVVKNVGAEEELISNSNLNHKVELLTLVRVSQGRFFSYPKYTPVDCTLPELLEDEDFSAEVEEELLVKDFKTSVESSGSGELGGGHQTAGEAAISAKCDSVDGLVEPVSIKKKKANLKGVRKTFNGRKLEKGKLKLLKMKEEDKLAFVHETLYNTGPVRMIRRSAQDGSISATYQKFLKLLVKGSRTEETTFTVPEKSTFAFGLQEILWDDETINIPFEPWANRKNLGLFTHDTVNPDQLQEAREGVQNKAFLLKPLTRLPHATRQNLLKTLQEVLEEDGALSQLEETLDQSSKGQPERPPSKVVSSFMDVLDESKVSSKVRDAVHLLVCAMDGLPELEVRPLTSCAPETLTVLVQLVDSLKDGDEPSLPACPPVPLQQDGGLRWAADVLCGSSETLAELSAAWDRRPEVLLEVLALAVLGVHRLQEGNGPDDESASENY
ncbi:uncharacterized protein LOC129356949 [Poeciliopsis prolifica]|uniref:uncharacterized protein LOC129356184 n=1 Tax=Poeciliopsis prolifica TaxID=188132 RepID=UPI002413DFBF|nr:uncharacterized protein LOC129356184 [Poeciliopsis prolifica]XP_054882459.1 uncharacterized protein LOC129356949 [Poeciliopsis prolifica]